MKVKNINRMGHNTCRCRSWLEHWKHFGGPHLPLHCAESLCFQEPELGAHVQKDGSQDDTWYIVPLCKKHNGQIGATLTISDSVALVPANVSETCGAVRDDNNLSGLVIQNATSLVVI